MPKFPEEVVLHPYTVRLRADYEACAAAGVTGQYMEDDLVIMLDDRRPWSVQVDSLLHELLHAIWGQSGMNQIVDSTDGKSDGEKVIRAITPRLIGLLRDNPWLVRAILNAP